MRFPDKYLSVYFFILFFTLVMWSFALYITKQKDSSWNFLFNVAYGFLYFSGGVLALLEAKTSGLKNSVGKELFSIGVGMVGFAMGLFVWAYYNLVLKVSVPYPSLADGFFILYIPFLGYGIINLLKAFGIAFSKRIYFESFVILLLSAFIIISIGNPPDLAQTTPIPAKAFNILYLLGDSFLISLGYVLIRLTHGKIHKSFLYFIAALFVMVFADMLFSYRTASNIYWNGDFSDLLYSFSGLLFSLGVVAIVNAHKKIHAYFPR